MSDVFAAPQSDAKVHAKGFFRRYAIKGFILLAIVLFLLLIGMAFRGCDFPREQRLDSQYGKRRGSGAGPSVNGTAALANMFAEAGHTVHTWSSLSPRLNQADCIVWFDDEFAAPRYKACDWLDDWLSQKSGRTLIYVGRDYDAEPLYWRKTLELASEEDMPLYRKRLASAQQRVALRRQIHERAKEDLTPDDEEKDTPQAARSRRRMAAYQGQDRRERDRTGRPLSDLPPGWVCPWFYYEEGERRDVRYLEGVGLVDTLDNIDQSKLEIQIQRRMIPRQGFLTILTAGRDVLVAAKGYQTDNHRSWRDRDDDSRLILVTNGSFLLNAPLVNHEHRKLAKLLIGNIGPSQRVVFLEGGGGRMDIRRQDETEKPRTGLELLTFYPLNWIFLHLAVVGILYSFWRWPIFGRAREPEQEARADFSRHIDAVGEMLHRGRSSDFVRERLAEYHRQVAESRSEKSGPAKP